MKHETTVMDSKEYKITKHVDGWYYLVKKDNNDAVDADKSYQALYNRFTRDY